MKKLIDHNYSSEWKEAMDVISLFFNGLVNLFPSNIAGYCKLKSAQKNSWDIEQLIDELNRLDEALKSDYSFWWDEWVLLLDSLEEQFDINIPREGDSAYDNSNNVIERFKGINYELPIERLAEIVSLLVSNEEIPIEFLLWENIAEEDADSVFPWSESLIQFTKDVLNELPIPAFMKGYCILKSIDRKYGKISLEDAISYRYQIKDIDTDNLIVSFDSLEELLYAGWVAD